MSKVKVLFVCLGNICRSPLAEGIFKKMVLERGLGELFVADSCGTAAYHIGNHPDGRSVENARNNGVDYDSLARQLSLGDFVEFDYILPMDSSNLRNIESLAPAEFKSEIIKMRYFDQESPDGDVPDPYYGGTQGFQNVFEILDRSVNSFLDYLIEEHKINLN